MKVGGLSQIVILILRREGGVSEGISSVLNISVNRLRKHYGKAR